ncbi:hypothetical protein Ahy_B02g058693 isoform A [Arachis hypogaea]|uniref:Uncharacterized protein n=1 Tax=Arachis hypogaea TaxID=3818 RepID=A0A445AF56_ARAHY|nr:hypothetical protein Ahy_B02g058693 isoform A [Arachis hypogaea]
MLWHLMVDTDSHMTTNLVECINSVLKGRVIYQSLHLSRQHITGLTSCSLRKESRLSLALVLDIMTYLKCVRCLVDWSMQLTYVDNTVIVRLDWQVYVHDVYKMDHIRRVYKVRFKPFRNLTSWPAYHGPHFVPNPFIIRVTKDDSLLECRDSNGAERGG